MPSRPHRVRGDFLRCFLASKPHEPRVRTLAKVDRGLFAGEKTCGSANAVTMHLYAAEGRTPKPGSPTRLPRLFIRRTVATQELPRVEWFRSSCRVREFIGNARQVKAGDTKLLSHFVSPSIRGPSVAGRIWPSYHHAALYLGQEVLGAVEAALEFAGAPIKVGDMPGSEATPTEAADAIGDFLKKPTYGEFDPEALRQNLAEEALRAGVDTPVATWQPPLTIHRNKFRFSLSTSPVPGDDARPPATAAQFHLDCFY